MGKTFPEQFHVWVIYDRPKDYPDGHIARLWTVTKDEIKATEETVTGTLEHMRQVFAAKGLVHLDRMEGDDPIIVETWI